MSKIEFVALGGLDEKGKNCYVLNINDNLFVINVGIFYQRYQVLGFESAIPDFKYLIDNKEKIKGVFIGSAFENNFGGIKFFVETLPNCPIFTTNINADIINISINADIKFNIIKSMENIKFGDITVTPFKITNSMPNSVGFIFNIGNENMIYMDDCVVCSSKSAILSNDLLKIIENVNNKNNILLTSAGNVSTNNGFTSPNFQVQTYFSDKFNYNNDRFIIALYSFEIYKIVSILNAASIAGKVVAFQNPNTVKLLHKMHEYKMIDITKFKIVDLASTTNDDKNLVVVIDAYPHVFFNVLTEICDEINPNILINTKDSFIFASQTISGLEKKEAQLIDSINKFSVNSCEKINSKYLDLIPGGEDLKFIASFIKPKYIIPISGLYMNFINYQIAMSKTGFSKKNVIILVNGQKLEINNGVANEKTEFIDLNSKLINIKGFIDEDDNSILERVQMKDNGVIIVSYIINTKEKIIKNSKYENVGVIGQSLQNTTIINTINNEVNNDANKIIGEMLENKDKIDTKEFKLMIRKSIVKQYEKKFDKKPLVMITLIFE
ncbi:MAG: ribonuclease J [Mycoplasmataceae bacterium]|jgi:ribonuclease J|nr:ribonuclease J [Mycoplasmataceae bacterium]